MNPLKMYILLHEILDAGHAVNTAAHAGAMILTRGWPDDDPIMKEWYETSFRKCTCKVTQDEFDKAREYGDYFAVQEMAFDNKDVALVFKPRHEWPRFFRFLPLWK